MSSTVLKRDCPQGDRIMASELFTDLAGRVRENCTTGLVKVVDPDGIFVAIYLPKSKMDEADLQRAMDSVLAVRPSSPLPSDPASKAITAADEALLSKEAEAAKVSGSPVVEQSDDGDSEDPVG